MINRGYSNFNVKCDAITNVKDINTRHIKSALSTVNTLMREKSIIETIEQIEASIKTGQINKREFKKKKERILSLIEKLPASYKEHYKEHNAKGLKDIEAYLDSVESTVVEMDKIKKLMKKRYSKEGDSCEK